MGGKKQDAKKAGGAAAGTGEPTVLITEAELDEAKTLPAIKDYVFTNVYAFKQTRNENRLKAQIKKQYHFINPEDPEYTEEKAAKFRTIDMNQLLAQAQSRGLLTEDEMTDPGKIDAEKKRMVLAQATIESVTAFQLKLRQKRKEEIETGAAAGAAPSKPKTPTSQKSGVALSVAQDEPAVAVDQVLLLQDFPQSGEDVKALIKQGFSRIHAAFLIEEAFNRDIEDEDDDDTKETNTKMLTPTEQSALEQDGTQTEGEKVRPEKLKNRLTERVVAFTQIVEMNRTLKKLQGTTENQVAVHVERMKFHGPRDPMDIPLPPEDGSEPPPIDEERKAEEWKMYDDFALSQKQKVEDLSVDVQVYLQEKKRALAAAKALWPVAVDPEAQARMEELENLRKSQIEMKLKEEEERRAAEAAAAKGGKKSAQQKPGGRAPTAASAGSGEGDDAEKRTKEEQETEALLKEMAKNAFNSQDDDPSKKWDFHQYRKATSEMDTGSTSVGSILGAMVYQITSNNSKRHRDALKPELYEKKTLSKKLSSVALKKKSTMDLLRAPPKNEVDVNALFDGVLHKLSIEHSVVETDYKHEFDESQITQDSNLKSSPYMVVKSDNDRTCANKDDYNFLGGGAQDQLEQRVLETGPMPGVNKRQDMPEKATMKQSQRESDQDQIVRFCSLPPNQTKRSLVLRAFELMMKKHVPEREFSFLDRNFIEEYKDPNTMRQILSGAVNSLRPDMITEYFEMDDGLLVSLFFKNPPGRLLRRQWTNLARVYPEFSEWRETIKDSQVPIDFDQILEIPAYKVGALRTNTKFSFPSDNSVIRVDKYQAGQKRMGECQIIKDNFIFGITERKDHFAQKADGEDTLRNRDAKALQDKRCDCWLIFENGVRLTIEMQGKLEANMDQIPLSQMPAWLSTKLEKERARLLELEEMQSEAAGKKSNDGDKANANAADADIASAHGSIQASADENRRNGPSGAEGARGTGMSGASAAAGGRSTDVRVDDQKDGEAAQDQDPGHEGADDIAEEEDPALSDPSISVDGVDMTSGAKLTFTFNEGLVVQILPNGDTFQKKVADQPMPKSQTKGNNLVQDEQQDSATEQHRIITTNGEIIKQMADGNFVIYYGDGAITYSDKRRGIWYTINAAGVKRVRRVKDRIVQDEMERLKIDTKIDPETNAKLQIREDGVLNIEYVDQSSLIVMPDGTNILKKKRADGEAGTVTLITKDGFVPIRQIYDPVKARARTVIGLGGTDALMGKDNIMERTNTGKISEVLLPDRTVVQSYLEKQEQEGYNNYSTSMIHIIKRDDFSVVKVRQDGEVVLISANERSYLNDIGKGIADFGTKDYDYFFELFGIANERRSGVYTANLDKGRIWTQDEEGNYFIVYANGDSVEKLSVSFNLDQMVEGIENKEPDSPRIRDGEYVEDECKFLPPPKSMAHPRLIYIKNDGCGVEYFNKEQLEHMFRTCRNKKNDHDLIQTSNQVKTNNEDTISHVFIQKKHKKFDAQAYNVSGEFPKLPQSLELVNQTVSIPTEPVVEKYTYKNVLEFKPMEEDMQDDFLQACETFHKMKAHQKKREQDLRVKEPKIITKAEPPQPERESRLRSTGMQSTMMMSQVSPRSSGTASRSGSMGSVGSRKASPRAERAKTKAAAAKQRQDEDAIQAAEEAIVGGDQDEEIEIDEQTGMQLYQNELEDKLTFMQKLQLRIAKQKNINIETLKGDEFKVLKDYKKLEERREFMNNVSDFFDPKYATTQAQDVNARAGHIGSTTGGESRPNILSDQGDRQFYSQDSNPLIKNEVNMLTIN